jgi:hypothetical protein
MYRQIAESSTLADLRTAASPRAVVADRAGAREKYGASRNTVRDAIRWPLATTTTPRAASGDCAAKHRAAG